jgi:hypothetical protein
MAVRSKHTFVNPLADEPGFLGSKPSDWNADHTVNLIGPALIGATVTGETTAVEIGVGAGLSFSGSSLINTGVTSAVAGTGISVSAATGAVTFTNTGVTSLTAGTGIGVSASAGAVTLSNTGVTSIVAGTNVTISGSTGAVTINAASGGGGFTPTIKKLTATQASTVVALANITTLVEAMVANATYEVEAFVTFQSAATTTGLNLGFTSPAGSSNQLEFTVPIASTAVASALRKIFPNAAESVSGSVLGTGVTAVNSNHTAHVHGFVHTGATAGNFQLTFATEVAGSAVTLQIGSSLIMKRLV